MSKKKKMIHDFYMMKQEKELITYLTAYDFPTAQFAEAAGLDMLLVGDSLGMCVYGLHSTVPVNMDMMIYHSQAVRRGAPITLMPASTMALIFAAIRTPPSNLMQSQSASFKNLPAFSTALSAEL